MMLGKSVTVVSLPFRLKTLFVVVVVLRGCNVK